MSFIQDIVVSVSNVTTNLRARQFTPIIIGTGAAEIEAVTVATVADLVDEGYTSTDEEYKALSKMLTPSTAPTDVVVYRKANATSYTAALDGLVADGVEFYCVTLTSRAIADIAEVATWCDANECLLVACGDEISDRGTFGYQEVHFSTAKAGGDATGLANDTTVYGMTVTVDGGTPIPVLVTGSAAQTWTNLLSAINADLGSAATAALVSGDLRITSAEYGTSSSVAIVDGATGDDANLLSTLTHYSAIETAVAGTLRSNARAALVIHNNLAADYPEMQWVGLQIAKTPGSSTWKWKRVAGQNAGDYTRSQLVEIRGSGSSGRAQALQTQKGETYFNEGITLGGRYLDSLLGQDWIKDQIQLEILNLLLTTEKVAMDDAGIPQLVGAVRKVMKRAALNGIIAAVGEDETTLARSEDKRHQFVISAPTRSELTTSDLNTRNVPGIEFTYYEAGAVHSAGITGIVTV